MMFYLDQFCFFSADTLFDSFMFLFTLFVGNNQMMYYNNYPMDGFQYQRGMPDITPQMYSNMQYATPTQSPKQKSKKGKPSRTKKNREAAQQFRRRQKDYLENLENEVATLTSKQAKYTAQADMLKAENEMIRQQQQFLRAFIERALMSSYPAMMQNMANMVENQKNK
eukprot:TRINITY_DN1028_c0_g1_i3.p1 TRINITY_DN1028_c0_g1~~TRINITY_DN1028_c0_g1_i3.p1  ORF type:complete len:168 (+),score=21.32 TRINITY_DN1028_c0_g1_i3:323-826(+)